MFKKMLFQATTSEAILGTVCTHFMTFFMLNPNIYLYMNPNRKMKTLILIFNAKKKTTTTTTTTTNKQTKNSSFKSAILTLNWWVFSFIEK